MKKLLLVMLLLLSFIGRAQNGRISYSNVVDIQDRSADDMFKAAKEWVIRTYGGESLQLTEDNKILFKGNITIDNGGTVNNIKHLYSFIGELQFKNGKYNYSLDNFTYQSFFNGRLHSSGNAADDYKKYNLSKSGRDRAVNALDTKVITSLKHLEASLRDHEKKGW